MMVLNKTYISRILSSLAMLSAGIVLSACFEIPSKPNEKESVKSISVYVKQDGVIDSTLLKIHPQDPAEISVTVHPNEYSDELEFNWYREEDGRKATRLGDGTKFHINKNASASSLPNKLVATDAEGNSLVSRFDIIINSPPKIDSIIKPQPSDTLYGNENTSFLFEWISHDRDNEEFSHTILLDGKAYAVGDFSSIRQSGFEKGEHTFQVIVIDNYGDSDSSEVIDFLVMNKGDK
ncbi:MAG: hypothetical protein II892_03125 [Fibrobacter sp.]|nr:hypothetical protein [Fibrobacter sp.]